MKDKITKWYKQGLWNIGQVRNAVVKNIITADDYNKITGNVYV